MRRKSYIKDGKIRWLNVDDARVYATLLIGNGWISNPTLEAFYADGWQEYIVPVPEPPSKEQQYKWRVQELIAKRYDMSDELALHRQRDTKVEEFAVYNTYCEDCKKQAHKEIYGE